MNAINEPARWDPFDPEIAANIHTVTNRIREEAPLYYNEQYDFYAVSRYEDYQRTLMDYETFSSARGSILEFIKSEIKFPPCVFISSDPPIHTAYRGPLAKVFSPRRVAALETQMRAFCAKTLDPLVESGGFDFVEHLGKELPMHTIAMLLGVPEDEIKAVQQGADAKLATKPGQPVEVDELHTIESFQSYIDWRIKNPSDDLMTELLNIEFQDPSGTVRRFTREEVILLCDFLATAGNDTTNRVLGWAGKVLADHPDQRRQIHENRALLPQAIEEVMRFEPPGAGLARYVAKDAEFHGKQVPAGSAICLLTTAANRDPRVFENPDAFDIHRERVPNVSFGHGFHVCLGNALARAELRIAIDEVLNRFPEWEVDLDNAQIVFSSTVRGWDSLPVYTPK